MLYYFDLYQTIGGFFSVARILYKYDHKITMKCKGKKNSTTFFFSDFKMYLDNLTLILLILIRSEGSLFKTM